MQLKSTIFGNAPIFQCGKKKKTNNTKQPTNGCFVGGIKYFSQMKYVKGQKKGWVVLNFCILTQNKLTVLSRFFTKT